MPQGIYGTLASLRTPPPCCLRSRNLTKRFGGLTAVVRRVVLDRARRDRRRVRPQRLGQDDAAQPDRRHAARRRRARSSWKDREIQGAKPHDIAAAGVVKTFQNPQLFAELSVFEHLMIAGPPDAQAAARLAPRRDAVRSRRRARRRGPGASAPTRGAAPVPPGSARATRLAAEPVLRRGEDARRGDGADVRARTAAARRAGLGPRARPRSRTWRRCCATCARTAPRCASSTTRSASSASSPTAPSACTTARRSPRARPTRC